MKLKNRLVLPKEVKEILDQTKVVFPKNREELFALALGSNNKNNNDMYEVSYTIPGIGKVVEATVARCKNGIAVNYTDSSIRKRDPNCMVIADNRPTDKETYTKRFGHDFNQTRNETFEWLKTLDELIVIPFMAGNDVYGYPSILIAPANAGFFAGALADIQDFIPANQIPEVFEPRGIMYLAPTFRHTHFQGKQVVVHNRVDKYHEVFSYNLYPGPSAKKGVYSILLDFAEKENWTILHASTTKVTTPYENIYTIMHEGASGGGKSEMHEQIQREEDGRILLGEGIINGDRVYMDLMDNSRLEAVTDDMALTPPDLQKGERLVVTDAESGWFLRVDNINEYGTELELERLTIHPPGPMIFINIDAAPNSTALLWEHILDENGQKCSNPRVVVPKEYFGSVKGEEVEVDLRSFGLRTPPTTRDNPGYGVVGLFHVLPPALAWLWRLVAPRGFGNPSINTGQKMESEGVGSYWPFATGRRVDQANILLKQMQETPGTRYVLIPNQHIGGYAVGFKGEWLSREYLSRRGHAPFREEELLDLKVPVLGYAMSKVKLDGKNIPIRLLNVAEQKYVGEDGFKNGAKILTDFFKEELKKYVEADLDPLGKDIIECFLRGGSIRELNDLMPGKYIVYGKNEKRDED